MLFKRLMKLTSQADVGAICVVRMVCRRWSKVLIDIRCVRRHMDGQLAHCCLFYHGHVSVAHQAASILFIFEVENCNSALLCVVVALYALVIWPINLSKLCMLMLAYATEIAHNLFRFYESVVKYEKLDVLRRV